MTRRSLTIGEAAAYLGYQSTASIRTLVHKGEIKPGGRGPRNCLMFAVEDLDAFLRRRGIAYAASVSESRPGDVRSQFEVTLLLDEQRSLALAEALGVLAGQAWRAGRFQP